MWSRYAITYSSVIFSIITSLLLFCLFVKPEKEYTPNYYQDNDKPVHPIISGDVNKESEPKRANNPRHYEPEPFHITTSLKEFTALYHRQIWARLFPSSPSFKQPLPVIKIPQLVIIQWFTVLPTATVSYVKMAIR